jgi:hypothetical protein
MTEIKPGMLHLVSITHHHPFFTRAAPGPKWQTPSKRAPRREPMESTPDQRGDCWELTDESSCECEMTREQKCNGGCHAVKQLKLLQSATGQACICPAADPPPEPGNEVPGDISSARALTTRVRHRAGTGCKRTQYPPFVLPTANPSCNTTFCWRYQRHSATSSHRVRLRTVSADSPRALHHGEWHGRHTPSERHLSRCPSPQPTSTTLAGPSRMYLS